MDDRYRIEKDSMGEVKVPESVYYGAQTVRARDNFPISGIRMPTAFIRVLGNIKKAAAEVNLQLGLLPRDIADAILSAAEEVVNGRMDDEFVVDVFQTGSGTSTNMNINEVIANRASELMGGCRGQKDPVHPNDHVNRGQSSNDVIPTAIHVVLLQESERLLVPRLLELADVLGKKAEEFDVIVKIGRTHLQDATPIRLGQEFSGYEAMIRAGIERIQASYPRLSELAMGGTAVGTGLNTHPRFGEMMAEKISALTGYSFVEAGNHFAAQGSRDAVVEFSGALKTLAVSLMKIGNDVRWLGSGPRCGIGEISIPELQPGSSIMPGKVNPVLAESLVQVAAQVIGNDAAVTIGGMSGNFELNVMMPMMLHNTLQSVQLLANGCAVFTEKCVRNITADEERCRSFVEQSLAMCTALVPEIGYDSAAKIAQEAWKSGKTVRQVVEEQAIIPEKQVGKLLDPLSMTKPEK
jgi:fumarate hydratase, class II